jgi:general secretion pathway protein A
MYAKFYGLEALAFRLTPDPRFFFDSAEHHRAMAHLTYGLHHAEGFVVITGDVGTGKTTLVDRMLAQIDPASFVTTKIVSTQLQGDDLLRLVASGFGLDHVGVAKATLLTRIQEFVLSQFSLHRRALLVVDEAQNLSFEALEELRMLSNIVVGTATALQSFLVGQPQFRTVLANPALDQLRQRITGAYHLGPLNPADTRAYVEHRLRCVGWAGDPEFEGESFALIHRHTDGVPRRINGLCSRLLLFGFLENSHKITGADTERVADDLRAELSAVTGAGPTTSGAPLGEVGSEPTSLGKRLLNLERASATHDRTIRRMIEIMTTHFNEAKADEPQ